MSKAVDTILTFNRGEVSETALARVDLERMQLSAETQLNFLPRTLGPMSLRPGMEYIDGVRSNAVSRHISFEYSLSDHALIELTSGYMRVRVNDQIITRPSVTAAVTNGGFDSDLSGWTNADETGATSAFETGGYLKMTGTGLNAAILRQTVTVTETGTVHALRVVVERGTITFRLGSTSGGEEYIGTTLGRGTHSLAFTPTGDFHIEISSAAKYEVLVDSVTVEAAGAMEIATPWTTDAHLASLRPAQSNDIIYVASDGVQQRRIERRGTESWSLVVYEPADGPYRSINTSKTTITPSGLTGNITLTSSKALFKSGHVGALFRISTVGQNAQADLAGEGQFTDYIRVVGVGSSRTFNITISGTWSGTVTLQRSTTEPGSWVDVQPHAANTSGTHTDGLDNQIVYYRLGIKTGDYTSGTAECDLTYSGGADTGVVRVTAVASGTSASAEVLSDLGATEATSDWYEGAWSTYRGWPTAVALYEARLWWAGKDRIWGSVVDAYESFDDDIDGDSGPISRSLGEGAVDKINWLLPLRRLVLGTEGAERSARSTSFDEPLTPTAFNLKDVSTQGSASVLPAKVDQSGFFVQSGGVQVYDVSFDPDVQDYGSTVATLLNPDIGSPGIVSSAVQRQPDTRIYFPRSDGICAVLVHDRTENVLCWVRWQTDGVIEEVITQPGAPETTVYFVVKRTINGGTVRYLEKAAAISETVGGTLNKQADAFKTFTNSPASATVSGLSHLEGESVVVWADGKCLRDASGNIATFTVSSGSISLTNAGVSCEATTGVVGLSYEATYKSRKLPDGVPQGTSLGQPKRVNWIGLLLTNTHYQGIEYGSDFTNMDSLPLMRDGAQIAEDTVDSMLDTERISFPGGWDKDARLCLRAKAPRPATIAGLIGEYYGHAK